ncbi:hypothetical protein RQP46_009369 [Phenoliferia psychrophenolica]
MILLEPHLDLAAGTLTLRVPAFNEFPASEHTIPIEPTPESEEHFDLKVWASPPLDGFDVGTDALNRALSDFMGKDCRLMKKGVERREAGHDEGWIEALKPSGVDLAYEEDLPSQIGWADKFPFLLTSEESLKDVETKVLTDEGVRSTPKFDHARWSPTGPPLEILPNVDPATGIRDSVVPDQVLRPYRQGVWPAGAPNLQKVFFGVHALPKRSREYLRATFIAAIDERAECRR